LNKLAEDNAQLHPKAAQMSHNDFYVDDLLSGSQTLAEAIQLQKDKSSILQQAGFLLRKWASNNLELLATIPENLRETQNVLPLDKEDSVSTLGLLWNPTSDQFQLKCQITSTAEVHTTNKHSILSTVASVFDPLGLISPIIISCKILLQKLWQAKLQQDEPVPTPLLHKWSRMQQQLPSVSHITINHKVLCANATDIQFHGFSDNSERAYGASLYFCSTDLYGEITCELLCAISKVAPIKKTTLPRLEVCSALLLANLYKKANRTHFLIGEPLTTLSSKDLTNIKFNRLSRWHQLQQQVQQFWK
jgi:hypothetical protein